MGDSDWMKVVSLLTWVGLPTMVALMSGLRFAKLRALSWRVGLYRAAGAGVGGAIVATALRPPEVPMSGWLGAVVLLGGGFAAGPPIMAISVRLRSPLLASFGAALLQVAAGALLTILAGALGLFR